VNILKAPLPVAILIVAILCPTELSLYLGPLRLPPHRVALLLFAVPAIVHLLSGRGIRLRAFDVLFMLYTAWTVMAFVIHLGPSDGLEFGGALALESFGGYVVARAYVRDYQSFRASLSFLFMAMCAVAMIALPESLLGKHFVHDWLYAATGVYHPVGDEQRLGFTRAYATFDHPILYGTFCASLFALVWWTGDRPGQRFLRVGIISFATFLGLSSAPLLTIALQILIISWEKLTRGAAGRVTVTLAILAALFGVLEVATNRPALEAIVTRITLDPWTAFYRIQIWTFGLENLWANPVFGIGLADWQRADWMTSASVDAFWLLVPMRAGLPALLLLLAAITLLIRAVHRPAGGRDRATQGFAVAWTVSLLAIGLAGLTVHYWNSIHAYCFMFLGLGAWMADPRALPAAARGVAKTARAPAEPRRGGFRPAAAR
jgi:hypothetical protein